jgi:hypothetical protein
MTSETPPFTKNFYLGDLNRGGVEMRISADAEALARIARWAEVETVESFAAEVKLRKHSSNTFSFDAALTADIVQLCVVTLEPVKSHVERHVHRELHHTGSKRHPLGDSTIALSQDAGEDDVPEEIDSLEYDLAAPLLEELVLAIDPYIRAPGVEFDAPAEPEPPKESPFAVLKSLKSRT